MTQSAVCPSDVCLAPSRSTAKERDTESGTGAAFSGLDYFGARYYDSIVGRFMSPDWSAKVEPVPYAKLGDPQSLNLYAYMMNNPLIGQDGDGHSGVVGGLASEAANAGPLASCLWDGGCPPPQPPPPAQQTNAQAFDSIWNSYPSHEVYGSGTAGTSGESVQQLTGVDVVDTCALRMSYALNQSGFTISKSDGKSAMKGSDGKYYLVAQADVGKFITKQFGAPQNIGKSGVAGFDQSAAGSGFVRFSIHFATGTATGHIALFKNGGFHESEDDYTSPGPGHWVVQGIQYWRMQ
jgi:RHS repeat-associated protein